MKEYTGPISLSASGLHNIFNNTKTYHVVCGACCHVWKATVSTVSDTAVSVCPLCDEKNVWSHSEFYSWYNARMREREHERERHEEKMKKLEDLRRRERSLTTKIKRLISKLKENLKT